MTIDVDDVATDTDLADHVGGLENLLAMVRDDASTSGWFDETLGRKTCKPARLQVLGDILQSLKNRRPPILDSDILYPSDLKYAVICGTLSLLYQASSENIDSPKLKLADMWSKRFAAEKNSVQPETRYGSGTSSLSIRIFRG